jgi:hypothetical protein
MKAQKIDPRIIRITDILHQVQNLNGMIALHRDKSQDGFMLRQYEYMRGGFLKELKEGLGVGAGELVEAEGKFALLNSRMPMNDFKTKSSNYQQCQKSQYNESYIVKSCFKNTCKRECSLSSLWS